MISAKITKFSSPTQLDRAKVLLGVSLLSLFMLGFTYTASAAVLTRQLEIGMSGSDVSDLQIFLAKDVTIYPQGLVTGYFGMLTQSAVSNFQARNGIDNVGRVGPITLSAINQQMNSDSMAPVINSLNVGVTNTSVSMNWNTNENASAIIYYSSSPLSMIEASPGSAVNIGGSTLLVNTNLQSSHTGTITGLMPNTSYYYALYVKDGAGNENITWPTTFRTNQ